VTVHEQSAAGTHVRFGRGRRAYQRNLEAADPATQADIIAAGRPHDMRMLRRQPAARVHKAL